ncbi:MAG: alpha/beta hydrolase [Acidobacteria bacterium]|nr:alpha/beta hydrolase [Acidobacteriota bacterium]
MSLLKRVFFKHSVASVAVLLFLSSTPSYATPMDEVKFVDVDGVRTGYVEGGSGEAMVLVHGGGFGSAAHFSNNWRSIFDYLASHFHVYAIDKLGQGHTDNPQRDADYTMMAVTQHIYRFMETVGIQKVHLVGHSRGALPAVRIAVDHPEMVQTLTLFDSNTLALEDPNAPRRRTPPATQPSAPPPVPTQESIRQFWSSLSHRQEFLTDEFIEAELQVSQLPKLREATEKMASLTAQWARLNPEKIKENPRSRGRWWYDEMKRETYVRINAGRFKNPTLIIWGYNDPGASYQLGINLYKIISAVIDRTELHLFNQCMHYGFLEYPREVSDVMISFIRNAKEEITN